MIAQAEQHLEKTWANDVGTTRQTPLAKVNGDYLHDWTSPYATDLMVFDEQGYQQRFIFGLSKIAQETTHIPGHTEPGNEGTNIRSHIGEPEDPLSLHRYAYVHNNPLRYVDPTGNYCVSQDGRWEQEGKCRSESSIFLGDDKYFQGRPKIEKGVVTGRLGYKEGNYIWCYGNYWDMYEGDYSYVRWVAGDNDYYYSLSRAKQLELRKVPRCIRKVNIITIGIPCIKERVLI